MTRLSTLDNITADQIRQLRLAGVYTTEQLLERGATAYGRMQLADMTQLEESQLLKWVEQADLLRVQGMSHFYSSLLCRIGVTSAPRLAYRSASSLFMALTTPRIAASGHKIPTLHELEQMIRHAKHLPKLIRH